MVAAKTPGAAAAGAEVLRGGNAVDAAVTTAFVAGVVEPWMNGIGGGGYMVVQAPDEAPAVVEYPMRAPAGATPEMFPLSGGSSDEALFGWPAVVDNANLYGYRSVAVPGTVTGLALALKRWGTISLAEALAPAIRWAEEGFPVYWHTTLTIGRDLATLKRFPATAAIFLDPDGTPPVTKEQTALIFCVRRISRARCAGSPRTGRGCCTTDRSGKQSPTISPRMARRSRGRTSPTTRRRSSRRSPRRMATPRSTLSAAARVARH